MKIIHEPPPMLEAIFAAGMAPRLEYAAFAYGRTLYIPGTWKPSEELLEHEETHADQHEAFPGGPDAWWNRYLTDPWFRVEQECAAYANQYVYYTTKVNNRDDRARYLHALAGQLSGPMYGNTISHGAAMKMIREKARL